jgi:hypothetical protein
MSSAVEPATTLRRLIPLVFLERSGRQRVRLGRLDVSQNTVVVTAALAIGVGAGYGAVGFRKLIDLVHAIAVVGLGGALEPSLGRAFVIVPLVIGGAIVATMVARFAPEAKGHGVPEVMAAVALRGGIMRPQVIFVKSLASAISIGGRRELRSRGADRADRLGDRIRHRPMAWCTGGALAHAGGVRRGGGHLGDVQRPDRRRVLRE